MACNVLEYIFAALLEAPQPIDDTWSVMSSQVIRHVAVFSPVQYRVLAFVMV